MLIISPEEEESSWWERNLAHRSSEKRVPSKATCCKVLTVLCFPSKDDWKVKASRILVASAGGSSGVGSEHPNLCSELTCGNISFSVERFHLDGSDMSFSVLWESRDLSSSSSVKVSLARTMFAVERTCLVDPVWHTCLKPGAKSTDFWSIFSAKEACDALDFRKLQLQRDSKGGMLVISTTEENTWLGHSNTLLSKMLLASVSCTCQLYFNSTLAWLGLYRMERRRLGTGITEVLYIYNWE